MQILRRRIRPAILTDWVATTFKDALTGKTPATWQGNDLQFELGIFNGTEAAPTPADLSNFASLKCEVFAMAGAAPTGAALMSKTVTSFADTLDLADWQAGTAQHAVFIFTAQESNLDLGSNPYVDFWMVFSGTTDAPDGFLDTFGHSIFRVYADGTPATALGPVQAGSIIPALAEYDVSGEYALSGLVAGNVYQYVKSTNDTNLVNGTETLVASGFFTAQGTTATLNGTPEAAVTATVRPDPYLTITQADARYLVDQLTWRGPWSGVTTYKTADVVEDDGSAWASRQDDNLNHAPPTLPTESNDWWELVAARGDTGATGAAGANGSPGAAGADGDDAYLYLAFASDSSGTGFSLTPAAGLDYVAFKASTTALTPVVGDFSGLWRKYIGTDGAGAGDMILAIVQTVTGAKTFTDGALRLNNAGGMAKATLRFAGTSNAEHTFPKSTGTVRLQPAPATLAYAATTDLDFDGAEWQEVTLTGNVVFTQSNAAAGKILLLHLISDDEDRSLTWPAWTVYGQPLPATAPANKKGVVLLRAFGTTAASVQATWIPLADAVVSYGETSVSATGSTTLAVGDCAKIHSHLFTVTDEYGGGDWTHTAYIPKVNAKAGDRVFVRVALPDSGEPTFALRQVGGSVDLVVFKARTFTTTAWAEFVFDGTDWTLEKFDHRTEAGAPVENLAPLGTVTFAASVAVDLDGPTYQEITATGDLELATLAASRAAADEAKGVTVLITASGGDRAISFATGVVGVGDTLPNGKTAAVCLLSTGANESNTKAAYAQLD